MDNHYKVVDLAIHHQRLTKNCKSQEKSFYVHLRFACLGVRYFFDLKYRLHSKVIPGLDGWVARLILMVWMVKKSNQ